MTMMMQALDKEKDIPLLHAAINNVEDIITIVDSDGVFLYVNDAFSRVTGFDSSEVIGHQSNLLKSGVHNAAFYKQMWDTISSGQVFKGTFVNCRKDGDLYHEYKKIIPVLDEQGDINYYISIGKDVTRSVNDQGSIHRLSYLDELTDLPRLNAVSLRLEEMLYDSREQQRKHAMLLLEINQIKGINDLYGSDMGNGLISTMSRQLQDLLKDATLIYIGGGRFSVFLEDIVDISEIQTKIELILSGIRLDASSIHQDLKITLSIGVSIFPEDGSSIEQLLKNAGLAIVSGKKDTYSNQYHFYTPFHVPPQSNNLLLEAGLLRALEQKEFILHYQPQVDIQTGEITGAEALLRWQHPERGMIYPDEFIPVLESSGLMASVGRWVLQEACRQNQLWIQKYGFDLSISVNISAVQLGADDFIDVVLSALSDTGMLHNALILELTEDTIIKAFNKTKGLLHALNNMNIKLAIDAFGTGYSSLLYLKDLPMSTIKLDRTFSQSMCEHDKDWAIAEAIVSITKSFSMKVVVEGIENHKQLSRVHQLGCHTLQGYLFSRPLLATDMTALLKSGRRL